MPVLKIKNNGVWEQVGGIPDHTHVVDDITDFPTSLPANGGNADTVDGKHASDFASAAEMTTVQNDINDINTVIETKLGSVVEYDESQDVVEMLAESEIVDPVSDSSNELFIENSNIIYVL